MYRKGLKEKAAKLLPLIRKLKYVGVITT